ncbi:ribosomal protein L11 methylase [Leptolyngbyaceae cyanobacterium JSC-12]|nr:ribosomal protein L11 methylase [Leptolyngbyaceae cyanobacterium JSC-12]
MNWIELSTDATHEAIDWIRTSLATIDFISKIQIKDYVALGENQIQNQLESSHWTFTAYIYLPNQPNHRTKVETIVYLLSPLHRTGMISEISVATVSEKEVDHAEPFFFRVGRFVIGAANVQTQSLDDIPLLLEPSLAFGSGLHPATILSLKLIERYVTPSMNTLDLGCGSGILSVAMAKLGARVLAIDNDAIAVEATQAAIHYNQVANQVTAMLGSLGQGSNLGHWLGGDLTYDIPMIQPNSAFNLITANILARIHITLVNDYRDALLQANSQTRLLITAGYTNDYAEEINETFIKAGFEQIDSEHLNEWTAFLHQLENQDLHQPGN